MRLAAFHRDRIFWMGQEDPPPEPEPEPEPTCRAVGQSFVENHVCLQMHECTAEDGTVTFEKRSGPCPLPNQQQSPIFLWPWPYPSPYESVYPTRTRLIIKDDTAEKTELEKALPIGLAAAGGIALLFAIFKK
jgi:hypothetical protein